MECPSDDAIAAFLQGGGADASAVREHLKQCSACAELVEDYAVAFSLPTGPGWDFETGGERDSAAQDDLEAGTLFGRFVLLMTAGRGGMGHVYVAYDPELDRKVAIKMVTPTGSAPSADEEARLVAEARHAAALRHPNIVEVFDVGVANGRAYIAMEYVQGVSLRAWLDAEDRTRAEVLRVFRQAAAGLQAAHDQGIVHRDFKPGNVLIDQLDRARIVDFGLARLADRRRTPAAGTPAYMAPEQLRGDPVDAAADQYAFCVALTEALHGKRGQGAAPPTLEGERPRAAQRSDRKLDAVLRRGLAPVPEHRWPSMRALVNALPGAGRGRVMAWGAGAVTLAIVAAVGLREPPETCNATADVSAVWGQRERARLREGILATRAEFADAAADAATRELDGYADRWLVANDRACVEAPAPERARACLRRGLLELQSTVELLAESDVDVAARVVGIVRGLPDPGACVTRVADPRATGLVDEADPEETEALEAGLADANALMRVGKLDRAAETIEPLVARAEALGELSLSARIHHRAGRIAMRRADYSQAAERLERAAWLASLTEEDHVVLDSLATLGLMAGDRFDDHETAERWINRAHVALQSRGSPPALEFTVLRAEGGWRAQRPDPHARELLERAVQLAEAEFGVDSIQVASTLQALGIALMTAGELEGSRSVLLRSLEHYDVLGPMHPGALYALGALTSVELMMGNMVAGREFAEREVTIARAIYGDGSTKTALAQQHAAMAYMQLDEDGLALEALGAAIRAIEAARGDQSATLISMLNSRAEALLGLERYPEAERDAQRSVELAELHGRAEGRLAAIALGFLASAQLMQGRFDQAQSGHERSLALRQDLGLTSETAVSLLGLAEVAEARAQPGTAVELLDQAIAAWVPSMGEEHPFSVTLKERRERLHAQSNSQSAPNIGPSSGGH